MDTLVFEKNDKAMTDSLKVAEYFEKQHNNVLRDVKSLDCSDDFRLLNFEQSYYKNSQGKRQPKVNMTFDGFMFLVMGYRGKKAARLKEAYISEFNRMRSFISQLVEAKADFKELADALKATLAEYHNYHFSNELNMINVIVLGMNAKQFKKANGLPAEIKSIRPHLEPEKLDGVDKLQKFDASLIIMGAVYEDRKRTLQEFWKRVQSMESANTAA